MRKSILLAGGLCGTTMLIAAEKIEAHCAREGQFVTVTIQNLWETSYVRPDYDLIIEMFPFFTSQRCPVISGKPFIHHVGEAALLAQIAQTIRCGEAAV